MKCTMNHAVYKEDVLTRNVVNYNKLYYNITNDVSRNNTGKKIVLLYENRMSN